VAQLAKNSVIYSFQNIKLGANDEVVAFEITISGGGFESITSLPKGWRISVDHTSAIEAVLDADLAFPAKSLTPEELGAVSITLTKNEEALKLGGHLMVMNLGNERRIPLSGRNFISAGVSA
jgi:hypothetical protein